MKEKIKTILDKINQVLDKHDPFMTHICIVLVMFMFLIFAYLACLAYLAFTVNSVLGILTIIIELVLVAWCSD